MSQLSVPNGSSQIILGVCGDQGSGKTVFLTCIFRSIGNAVSNNVSFDRDHVGNASYFARIEADLIKNGPTAGTRLLFPARIYIKPYNPAPGA
jgi:ABC-type dipeptide/oligopeptide/nickel transport system ATPase component